MKFCVDICDRLTVGDDVWFAVALVVGAGVGVGVGEDGSDFLLFMPFEVLIPGALAFLPFFGPLFFLFFLPLDFLLPCFCFLLVFREEVGFGVGLGVATFVVRVGEVVSFAFVDPQWSAISTTIAA